MDDLVGLVGVFDGRAVLYRRGEKPFLLDELDTAAAHTPLGYARPLAAQKDHRRVLHERAHHRPRYVGHAWAQCADAQAGLTGHAGGRLGHETGAQLVVRRNHRPATRIRLGEHVHEVRVGDAEQRIDALGLEEVEDTLVDRDTHMKLLDSVIDSVERVVCDAPPASRTANG